MLANVGRNGKTVNETTKSMFELALEELTAQLTPDTVLEDRESAPKTVDVLPLYDFVEKTSKFILEPWQVHLCNRLERLTYEKGQRILIHKPPQHGGSVIVSQRLPAYLIGDNPITRVKLACYNIEHATTFTSINKQIMQTSEYQELFPSRNCRLPLRPSDKKFSTAARIRYRDGQSSLMALGLLTGFVGQGADHLLIDDPYASPQEALSPAVNKSVQMFWESAARTRIDDNTNVIVMFHRYWEDDITGFLIKNEGLQAEGGKWELISYRAEWDGDESIEVGGKDPLNRKIGVYLSPRKAAQPNYYREQKKSVAIWRSQFQGKPSSEDGNMFKTDRIKIIPTVLVKLVKLTRAWDTASSEDGDYTVGVLMGLGEDKIIYILHVERFKAETHERNKRMKRTCLNDRLRYRRIEYVVCVPQNPSDAGKDQATSFQMLFAGFTVSVIQAFNRGDKTVRADPWGSYCNAGLVKVVFSGNMFEKNEKGDYISWVPEWYAEHKKFPNQLIDDQVDASSDGFSELVLDGDIPAGEDFDTLGRGKDSDLLDNLLPTSNIVFNEENDFDTMMNEYLAQQAEGNTYEDYYSSRAGTTNSGSPPTIIGDINGYGKNKISINQIVSNATGNPSFYRYGKGLPRKVPQKTTRGSR